MALPLTEPPGSGNLPFWKSKHVLTLVALMAFGAVFRFTNLNWDGPHQFHSDERNVCNSIDKLYFNSWADSNFDPKFYVYGALQVYASKVLQHVSRWVGMDLLTDVAARAVSATFGVLTILMIFLLGRRYFNERTGIIAAAFLTFTVHHIQTNHFGTVESSLIFWFMGSVWAAAGILEKGRMRDYALAGLFVGATCATKFSGLSIGLPMVIAHLIRVFGPEEEHADKPSTLWGRFAVAGVIAGFVGFIGSPHQILKFTDMNYAMTWEGGVVMGKILANYVYQFTGTLPYIFHLKNLFWFHFGPLLGATAIIGFFYLLALLFPDRDDKKAGVFDYALAVWVPLMFVVGGLSTYVKDIGFRIPGVLALPAIYFMTAGWVGGLILFSILSKTRKKHIVFLSWVIFYFGFTGGWHVKFMRYMAPLEPFFLIGGAYLFDRLLAWQKERKWKYNWAQAGLYAVIATSVIYSLAYLQIYLHENTRNQAQEWLAAQGKTNPYILIEYWDDTIPLPAGSQNYILKLFENESRYKNEELAKELARADYLVLSSKRVFQAVFKIGAEFPATQNYYRSLFAGDLGYDLVKTVTSYPRLLGVEWNDDEAEGSFEWVDHPKVQIFANVRRLPQTEILQKLSNPSYKIRDITLENLIATDLNRGILPAGQTGSPTAAAEGTLPNGAPKYAEVEARMPKRWPSWSLADTPAFTWWLCLQFLGLLVFPITFTIFSQHRDRGYIFSKWLGVVLLTWLVWVSVSLRFLEFNRNTVFFMMAVLALISLPLYLRQKGEIHRLFVERWKDIAWAEGVFLVLYGMFLWIRTWNPDLYWSEKPMDLSFTNLLLRSHTLPPEDPWCAGYSINYYYYGQMILATLIKATQIPTHTAFNLAMGMIPAFVGLFAFAVAWHLTRRRSYAIFSLLCVSVFGEFDSFRQIGEWLRRGSLFSGKLPGFDWWHAAHEIIPYTINEFPYWSFLFSDVHAHVIVMPSFMLLLAFLIQFYWSGRAGFGALGKGVQFWLTLAAVVICYGLYVPSNTWDAATMGSFFLLVFLGLRLVRPETTGRIMEVVEEWRSWVSYLWRKRGYTGSGPHPIPALQPAALGFGGGMLYLRPEFDLMAGKEAVDLYGFANEAVGEELAIPRPTIDMWELAKAGLDLFLQVLAPAGVLIGLGVAAYYPYLQHYHPIKYGLGWEEQYTTTFGQFATIFGLLASLAGAWLLLQMFSRYRELRYSVIAFLATTGLWAILATLFYFAIRKSLGWDYTVVSVLLPFLLMAVATVGSRWGTKEDRFAALGLVLALGVIIGVEIVHVVDFMGHGTHRRMNTLFKFHLHGWLLLSTFAGYALYKVVEYLKKYLPQSLPFAYPFWTLYVLLGVIIPTMFCDRLADSKTYYVTAAVFQWWRVSAFMVSAGFFVRLWQGKVTLPHFSGRMAWQSGMVTLMAACLWYGVLGAGMWTLLGTDAKLWQEGRFRDGAPGLDGFAYMKKQHPDEYEALRWIQDNVEGTPVVVEAWGPYYQEYAQVAMNTGLPTVLGWDSHVSQWNHPGNEVSERRADIQKIYETQDLEEALKLLNKYSVRYIYLGRLERKQYNSRGFKKFEQYQEFFGKPFDNGGVQVYHVIDRATAGQTGEARAQASLGTAMSPNVGEAPGQMQRPADLLLAPNGTCLVADTYNHRLNHFDAEGRFLESVGMKGSGPGQFDMPHGLAWDSAGNLLVADSGNDRVQVFDPSGNFLHSLGEGSLFRPLDVTGLPDGRIAVTDTGNNRIVFFSDTGEMRGETGKAGKALGEFRWPCSTAVAKGGSLLVMDIGSLRVQVLSPEGKATAEWPVKGSGDISKGYPTLSVDSKGAIYLADPAANAIYQYTPGGTHQRTWAQSETVNNWQAPVSIAFDAQDNALILSSADSRIIRRVKPESASMFNGAEGSKPGQFKEPRDLACDPEGNVYVSDFRNFRIQKFDAEGNFLLSWGAQGDQDGQFKDACGIAVAPDGSVYVADTWNFRVQKFDSEGRFIDKWNRDFNAPRGIATDRRGFIYVCDSGNCRIVKMSPNGDVVRTWGGARGSGTGQFSEPIGICVDVQDKVYICDTWNKRIEVYTTDGGYVRSLSIPGMWTGDSWREPYIDTEGDYLYVADPPNNRVLRISKDGKSITASVQTGTQAGLNIPMGIGVLDENHIFVGDTWNHRIVLMQAGYFRSQVR